MKTTSFGPQLIVKDAESAIELVQHIKKENK